MADTLAYLDGVAAHVSNNLLPSELKDVAHFLLGRQWLEATGALALPTKTAGAETGSGKPSASLVNRESVEATVRIPNGLVAWHGFIPLAIGATSMVSILTTDGRAALSDFFLKEGFTKVFAVNFMPGASATSASFSAVSGSGALEAPVTTATTMGRVKSATTTAAATSTVSHARHVQQTRMQCMDAIRRFCAVVEEEAKAAQGSSDGPLHKRPRHEPLGERADAGATEGCEVRMVRRLLVVVRCCADNRSAASTQAGSGPSATTGSAQGSGRGGRHRGGVGHAASDGANGSAARRLRHGRDPLHLLLHDVAAVVRLTEARLTGTAWRVRVGVLVLPDDHVYGGSLLARRLGEEVGHHYCVRLFRQGQTDTAVSDHAGRTVERSVGSKALPPSRARRVLRAWEPNVLLRTHRDEVGRADNSGQEETAATAAEEINEAQLEALILREERFFFTRAGNLPLCCLLKEALRLFPVVVPLAVLQQWQVLWAARHALQDVVLGMHAALSPFIHTTTLAAAMDACWSDAMMSTDAAPADHLTSTSTVPSKEDSDGSTRPDEEVLQQAGRQRKDFGSVLTDATDLLDALLASASSLSNGDELDGAVLFALHYEDLVQQRLLPRLSRLPAVTQTLRTIYLRELGAYRARAAPGSTQGATVQTALSATDCIRRALSHHLPFFSPSRAVLPRGTSTDPKWTQQATPLARHRRLTALPAVVQLTNLRAPAGPALQHTLLTVVQPPSTSLLELQAAATAFTASAATALLDDRTPPSTAPSTSSSLLSPHNFFSPLIPDSVRALYVLTAHATAGRTDKQKFLPVVQLQQVCQLSDERLLLVFRELQLAGLAVVNLRESSARTTLTA